MAGVLLRIVGISGLPVKPTGKLVAVIVLQEVV